MRTQRIRTATIAVLTACTLTSAAWADDLSDPAFRAEVAERFPGVSVEAITPAPVDGLYQISQGGTVGYITADGRYLLDGDLIDLEKNVNLTSLEHQRYRAERLAEVDEQDMIIFHATDRPDDPAQAVTIFTDVDCPYCRRLHARIDEIQDAGIEVRYLAFPLAGPGSESFVKAQKAWCASDRQQALTRAKRGETLDSTADCNSPVMAEYELARQELRLRGTPSIIAANGEILSPGLPIPKLIERLRAIDRSTDGA